MKKYSVLIFIIIVCVVLLSTISLGLIFPRKNIDIIRVYANKYVLPVDMVMSVINIESGFDSNAVSDAGAVGVMQIMQSTATDCARRMGLETEKIDLYDLEINLDIGCFYLSYLMGMFGDNVTNVLTAYNWGLGNVKNWIGLGNVDEDGTITNIPVVETKNYLKKFRLNIFVYGKIYKVK